jgi:hypothetical protein
MKTLSAVTPLRTIWEHQFEPLDKGGRWRQEPVLPATQHINSPYDLDARTGREKSNLLDGLQGACYESPVSDLAPQLITHVETTPATGSR